MHPPTPSRSRRYRLALAALVALLSACDGAAIDAHRSDASVERRPAVAPQNPVSIPRGEDAALATAIRTQARDVRVGGTGTVLRLLRDDTAGSPHQRFVMRVAGGTTLLVAHNIELAPRLDGLRAGDTVEFRGEYVWNPQGGTLHWTHHDPRGKAPGAWLRWRGRTYE